MRSASVVLATAIVGLVLCVAASAQAATVTIDTTKPALEERDAGGWTVALGFTNLTNTEMQLTAAATDVEDQGCALELTPATLPVAQHAAVTVTVPAGCEVGDDGFDFVVTPGGTGALPARFEITAAPKPDAASESWRVFWTFPILLVGLLAVAVLLLTFAPTPPAAPRPQWGTPLKYLKATWSFKDSWVSNVTVAGGLLAGLFSSSEILTSLLGKEAETSVAIASVGAAVAVAFTGAGAIVLFATKTTEGDFFSVGGLLAASAVTLTGAYGQLVVVYEAGRRLDLSDGARFALVLVTTSTAILLGMYVVRSLIATIDQGLNKKPAPSETIVATKMIVEALKAPLTPDERFELDLAIESVEAGYPATGTSLGDDYVVEPRSAML